MSRLYISEELRRLVVTRADYLCEYCLIHKEDTFLGCEVDHILERQTLMAVNRYPTAQALVRMGG